MDFAGENHTTLYDLLLGAATIFSPTIAPAPLRSYCFPVRRRNILPPGADGGGSRTSSPATSSSALSARSVARSAPAHRGCRRAQLRALGASEHADELLPNARAVLEEVGRSGQAGVFSSEVAERVGLAAQTHFVAETLGASSCSAVIR